MAVKPRRTVTANVSDPMQAAMGEGRETWQSTATEQRDLLDDGSISPGKFLMIRASWVVGLLLFLYACYFFTEESFFLYAMIPVVFQITVGLLVGTVKSKRKKPSRIVE